MAGKAFRITDIFSSITGFVVLFYVNLNKLFVKTVELPVIWDVMSLNEVAARF